MKPTGATKDSTLEQAQALTRDWNQKTRTTGLRACRRVGIEGWNRPLRRLPRTTNRNAGIVSARAGGEEISKVRLATITKPAAKQGG